VISGPGAGSLWSVGERPVARYRGWMALLMGDAAEAKKAGAAVLEHVAARERTPWNDWFLSLLAAEGHAFVRDPELAIAHARQALELMPCSRDASRRGEAGLIAAAAFAWSGAEDDAVSVLEELAEATLGVGPAWVARDPLYTVPLASNARYRALTRRLEAQLSNHGR
jgi:hypothetical protein